MCISLRFYYKETRNILTILTKMDLQIVGELNETYERNSLNLKTQCSDELIDEWLTELKN